MWFVKLAFGTQWKLCARLVARITCSMPILVKPPPHGVVGRLRRTHFPSSDQSCLAKRHNRHSRMVFSHLEHMACGGGNLAHTCLTPVSSWMPTPIARRQSRHSFSPLASHAPPVQMRAPKKANEFETHMIPHACSFREVEDLDL